MYTTQNQYSEILDRLISSGLGGKYEAASIHDEIFSVFGVVPLSQIPESNFWAIVGKYEIGRVDPWRL